MRLSSFVLRSNNRRGFSLTELAIVFGVVGVILGAIWSSYAAAQKNARIRTSTDDVMTIVSNAHALFSGINRSGAATSADQEPSSGLISTSAFLTAKIIPQSMLDKTTSTTPYDVWRGGLNIKTGVTDSVFRIYMDRVPADDCARFIAGIRTANGLGAVQSSSGWIVINTAVYGGSTPSGYTTTFTPTSFTCPTSGTYTGTSMIGLEFSNWDTTM